MTRFFCIAAIWFSQLLVVPMALAQTNCDPFVWSAILAPADQDFEVVERIEAEDGREVMGIQFGELTGQYAKVFMYIEFVDGCFSRAVSLGRYAYLLALSDEPSYHLDLYTRDTHFTLDFYGEIPEFNAIRAIAFEQLNLPQGG